MHSFSLLFHSDLDSLGFKFAIAFDVAQKMYDNPYYQKNDYQNSISFSENQNQYDYFDLQSGQWIKNTNFSNNFSFKEYIASVFSNFSSPLGEKSKISVGLRGEYNYNDYFNKTIKGDNDNFRLLPNVLYSVNSFYIQASQGIAARPNYYLFNPKYVKTSPTEAYTGNENLKPIDKIIA